MPAPIAKGLIILTTVLIAAGYAVYENREQVREFINRSRQKVSFAMHSFADDIMPSEEERERGREEQESFLRRGRPEVRNQEEEEKMEEEKNVGDDAARLQTGRDVEMRNSTIRYRSQHRTATEEDDFETLPEGNKVLFDYATEANPFADINEKAETSSTVTDHEPAVPLPAEHENPFVIAGSDSPSTLDRESTTAVEEPTTPLALAVESTSFVPTQPYWSIHEWTQTLDEAQQTNDVAAPPPSSEPSLVNVGSNVDSSDDDDRVDLASDDGVESSLDGSWSEVGSEVSDGEGGHH